MQGREIYDAVGSQGLISVDEPLPPLFHDISSQEYAFLPKDIADYILGRQESVLEEHFDKRDSRSLSAYDGNINGEVDSTKLKVDEVADCCQIAIRDEPAMIKQLPNATWYHDDVQSKTVASFRESPTSSESARSGRSSCPIEVKDDLERIMTETGRGKENMVPERLSEVELNLLRKFHSQPIPSTADHSDLKIGRLYSGPLSGSTSQKDNFYFFKTRLAKFEKQISRLHSKRYQDGQRSACIEQAAEGTTQETMPARRYFDALKSPELDVLKDYEDILLPLDKKWPFLLRFPIGCFGITLGLGSQTILWKSLATTSSMDFLHVPRIINLILWCLAVMTLLTIFVIYILKCVFYFEAVRREYYHPVRINFFFAPWIACMLLTIGVPPAIATSIHPVLWCVFMTPIFILELKIYGQWLSGGRRRLSKVANPSTHLSLAGNFVGALLASEVGWKEVAILFWAVGLAHYLVLFVTLYQRLPTAQVLPKELHPVFFLFVAAPSTASIAWESIVEDFDLVSRIAYFVGLFLYSSLVVRLNFFCGFRFSMAWWAYTFPMTVSSIAAIQYSNNVTHLITQGLAVILSFISAVMILFLFCSTILHTFFWRTIFVNDMAIAITPKRSKRRTNREKRDGDGTLHEINSYSSSNCRDNGFQLGESAANI